MLCYIFILQYTACFLIFSVNSRVSILTTALQVEAPVSAPAYERIRDAAAAASSPGPTGAVSPRLYSPAPAALTTTVSGQSAMPGGSQVAAVFRH